MNPCSVMEAVCNLRSPRRSLPHTHPLLQRTARRQHARLQHRTPARRSGRPYLRHHRRSRHHHQRHPRQGDARALSRPPERRGRQRLHLCEWTVAAGHQHRRALRRHRRKCPHPGGSAPHHPLLGGVDHRAPAPRQLGVLLVCSCVTAHAGHAHAGHNVRSGRLDVK
jgi:hypothetical protein